MLKRIDVPRLMVLRAIRDAGGILAASDELGVSASAVSQQLAKLEHETNLLLVARVGNAASQLTPAGMRLAERADAIARELRATDRDIAVLTDDLQRKLVVGGFPSVIQALLVPATRSLRTAVPSVDVKIVETREEGPQLHAALRVGTLDLVLAKKRAHDELGTDITETVIRDDPYRIVVPASWPVPTSISDLIDRPWVRHPHESEENEAFEKLQRQEAMNLRFEHECTEYPVAIAIASAGLAACIVPELAISSTPLHNTRVLTYGDIGYRRIVARHLSGRDEGLAAATVLDQLRQHP